MRIKDIGIVVTGKTPSTNNLANYSTNDCMFVTPDDILDDTYIVRKTKRYISRTGLQSILSNSIKGTSIAVTCIGEVGRCAILHDSCATNQQINSITDIDTKIVEPVALYYWFKCCGKQLINYASQTVMPIVSKSTFENIQIELPDIEHQKALVNMLSHVDDLIENNTNLSNKLSDIISLIYAYWFVQFDFPDENGRPYKSSGGKMVYNEQLEQEIPEGWRVSSLLDTRMASLIKPGVNEFDGTKTYLATGNVVGAEIKNNPANVTFDNRETRANMQPVANSVWFAKMKDSIKHIIVTDKSDDLINDHIFSTGFCGFLAGENCLGFLAAYVSQPQFEVIKDSLAHGATQKAVSNSDLSNIKIIEPSTDILCKFEHIAKPMLDLTDNCRRESKLLTSLRDWLLPMLMNGQVEIN